MRFIFVFTHAVLNRLFTAQLHFYVCLLLNVSSERIVARVVMKLFRQEFVMHVHILHQTSWFGDIERQVEMLRTCGVRR